MGRRTRNSVFNSQVVQRKISQTKLFSVDSSFNIAGSKIECSEGLPRRPSGISFSRKSFNFIRSEKTFTTGDATVKPLLKKLKPGEVVRDISPLGQLLQTEIALSLHTAEPKPNQEKTMSAQSLPQFKSEADLSRTPAQLINIMSYNNLPSCQA